MENIIFIVPKNRPQDVNLDSKDHKFGIFLLNFIKCTGNFSKTDYLLLKVVDYYEI